LTPESVYSIGRAIGAEAALRGAGTLAVGRDARLSSPSLSRALIRALCDSGCEVLDVGRVPTPLLYFAAHQYADNSGVMVTASHNPAEDLVDGIGACRRISVSEAYLDRISGEIELDRPLKVVVDAGNGMAGELAPRLFRRLGCEVHELYCDIDGRFPNHHPDPTELVNLQDLIAAVRETSMAASPTITRIPPSW